MRNISENDLSVLIALLAAKLRDIRQELSEGDDRQHEMSDEELNWHTDSQDLLVSYELIMD